MWGSGLPEGRQCLAHLPHVSITTSRFPALHDLDSNTELITLLLEAQAAVDIKDNKARPDRQDMAVSKVDKNHCPLWGPLNFSDGVGSKTRDLGSRAGG